jgi:hypothetical protein
LAPSQITGTAVVDSDSRLTDARTPTAHASTHNPGQSDALDLTKIVGIGAALPTLPDSLYPAGSLFGVGSVAPYLLYRSTGSAWDQIGGAGGSSVTTDDTAPVSPSDGDLWYDSTTGKTFVWYEDGSSDQWVEVGTNGQLTIPLHGSDHVRGGSDVIDGDRLTVDFVPSYYTRNSAASGAGDVTDLTAHLSGIDNLFGPWQSFTPQVTQSVNVTSTVTYSKYIVFGKTVIWNCRLLITGSGTSGQPVSLTLPVNFNYSGSASYPIGNALIFDASVSTYNTLITAKDATSVFFYIQSGSFSPFGTNPSIALTNNDQILLSVTYESL